MVMIQPEEHGTCVVCDAPLVVLGTIEYLDLVCDNANCGARGIGQPERGSSRWETTAFEADGTITTLAVGLPYDQNEQNLPNVARRLNDWLKLQSVEFDVAIFDGEREGGVDLVATCGRCGAQVPIQVARDVGEEFARDRRNKGVALHKTSGRDVGTQLKRIVQKKTSRHADRRNQVLVIDAVASYWAVVFSGNDNLAKLREILDDRGWKGVLLVGRSSVIESGRPWSCNRCGSD